ncbi:hypothetical protein Tco_1572304 [Tanacetum coccineum]
MNINRLITNIESLNDNPTLDRVLKSPSSFPIPVADSDSFFEEFNTSLSYSVNSLPEFETFSDHKEETSSGSTTTHAINLFPSMIRFILRLSPIRIFDPGIFIEVQSERLLSWDAFGILSSPLLSQRDKIISDFSKSSMMISRGDIPHLDVPFLHFYPP